MDFQSLSPRKKVFVVIGIIAVMLFIIGVIKLSTAGKNTVKKATGPKEISVWVVGDETAGYSDIISDFKAKYPQYAGTDIKFTKFGSYSDYEQILLNVMSDGNGPDIFVVNNNGGSLLDGKMLAIPSSAINVDDFSKRFARPFDDLILSNQEKNDKGEDITVRYLKGVPLGYETLGVFYNWRLIKNIPTTWTDIDTQIQSSSGSDTAFVGLGYGEKYTNLATDIFTLFLLQNNVKSYKDLLSQGAKNALMTYLNYGMDPANNLIQFKDQMDQVGLTTTDLFVRGKIGMILGYPSLLREIEYSIKRAGGEANIGDKFLRTAELPQVFDIKDKMTNIINYSYFVLSKYSKNPDAAQEFLAYLSTPQAEEKYLKNFPYYLPAQTSFESDILSKSISKTFDRTLYQSFLKDGVDLVSFDKGLKNPYDTYFSKSLDTPKESPGYQTILADAQKYINCQIDHFVNNTGFEEQCK